MIKDEGFPFRWTLAVMALNTWVKCTLKLRVTSIFGPMFKMLLQMSFDLGQFMVFWLLVIISFSCVANLAFEGMTDDYSSFDQIILKFFEASLGSWDVNINCYGDERYIAECYIGQVFIVIFLLANMVLLLNFVIAILSSTYAAYEDKSLGLYYEVIVALFPSMDFDEQYGAIPCAQQPLDIVTLPFQLLTILPLSESFLTNYNSFLCHVLYFPIALVFTITFIIVNIVLTPIAYVSHIISLIQTITNSDETMDEFSEKLNRVFTIIKFILFGMFYLIFAIFANTAIFFYNLYTLPEEASMPVEFTKISDASLTLFKHEATEYLKEYKK